MTFRDYSFGSKVLGEGYSSVVYQAKKYKSKNQFALKIFKEDFIKSETHQKLINNEIKLHNSLKNHHNFVKLIQHGPYENTYVFVMELCQKGSLADFLLKNPKISQTQAIYIIKEVISAYRVLHSLNILHRDIKPGNILITQQNEIKLCDFGLSVNLNFKNDIPSYKIGTPCFMAPQVIQSSIYSQQSDIWSIGVTYFLMLAGELPFKSQNHQNFLNQIKQTSLQTIIPANFSDFSRHFVLRTLSPDPKQRMSTNELFNFEFENPSKQFNIIISQKQFRSQSEKGKHKTIDKTKLTKTLDKKFCQKTIQVSDSNRKESRKTQATQNSQSSISGKTLKDNLAQKNVREPNKQTSIYKNRSIQELFPRNEESPRKTPLKRASKQAQKSHINQMQKITRILIIQIDFLRYINRVSKIVETYFKGQFPFLKQQFKQYVQWKFHGLKNFMFIQKEKLKIYKNYPLYNAWNELITDYQKVLKPSKQIKSGKQPDLEKQLSKAILDIYIEFDKSLKTKLNASKLVTLDHLICLKDLLQMNKKGDNYFLKNSMLHLILEGLQNINIDLDQIEVIFAGISKKLSE